MNTYFFFIPARRDTKNVITSGGVPRGANQVHWADQVRFRTNGDSNQRLEHEISQVESEADVSVIGGGGQLVTIELPGQKAGASPSEQEQASANKPAVPTNLKQQTATWSAKAVF